MSNDEIEPLLSWTHPADTAESTPPPKVSTTPSNTSTEHRKFDYDKLIAKSTGLYKQWWIMWKRIHPEWTLIPEKEPAVKLPPKPKATFKQLTCKRCNRSWNPHSKNPPTQCPKCKLPYWNRNRVK